MDTDVVSRLPADLPVVYALLAFTPLCSQLIVFYVGQTEDVARRLLQHLRSPDPFRRGLHDHLSTYFTLAHVSDTAVRSAAEGALIRMLRPAGNNVQPNTLPVAVTPPPTNILPLQ